ncbi:MAG: hypothetical protein P8177_08305, partial [Gemmatimonadota bacterium]
MTDETTIPRVADIMARRVADRLGSVLDEEPRILARQIAELDSWALETMLRLTHERAENEDEGRYRHLGVVGVDHSLNRLVVEPSKDEPWVTADLE